MIMNAQLNESRNGCLVGERSGRDGVDLPSVSGWLCWLAQSLEIEKETFISLPFLVVVRFHSILSNQPTYLPTDLPSWTGSLKLKCARGLA